MVIIKQCTCKDGQGANYQDMIYGKGMRVCNVCDKKGGARCSVCGTIHK